MKGKPSAPDREVSRADHRGALLAVRSRLSCELPNGSNAVVIAHSDSPRSSCDDLTVCGQGQSTTGTLARYGWHSSPCRSTTAYTASQRAPGTARNSVTAATADDATGGALHDGVRSDRAR